MPSAVDAEGSGSSGDDSSDEEVQVESLVAGRNKRVTAGNRMSSLLEKEVDDELELLFAEDDLEEDVEFEGDEGEDVSDVQLDSSSDDDDHGPTAGADDLEGEKELQKQDRQERRQKRKAQELFKRPPTSRTKVKVDPTTAPALSTTPLPRSKKKSERVSWLPTTEEGPTRSSSRKQTIQNKEVVHQRMQESEKRRRHQIEVMEAAAKRKEASKPKTMTQADRMAEAARTEKKNAKSLNRWEETERKRAEDQKLRLAALHNRQLQGPVISWWSGPSKWVNGKLVKVGVEKVEEIHVPPKSDAKTNQSVSEAVFPPTNKNSTFDDPDIIMPDAPDMQLPLPGASEPPQGGSTNLPSLVYSAPPPQGPGFLEEIQYYAATSEQGKQTSIPPLNSLSIHVDPMGPVQAVLPITEYSTRTLVTLENIDPNAIRIPELQNHVLLRKKAAGKLQSQDTPSLSDHQANP